MKENTFYLSVGINQTKKSVDWNTRINLIAYAACNRIVLYDIQKACVIGVSNESHGNYINSVQWIQHNYSTEKNYLLSTSTNGSAKLWLFENTTENRDTNSIINSLKSIATLTGHTGSVSCGYTVSLSSEKNNLMDDIFIVTTGEDYLIKGWKVSIVSGVSNELFSYKLPGRSLALDLLILQSTQPAEDGHWPLIIYGGDDGKVHLMISEDGQNYAPSTVLVGHQDWVTCLSYRIEDDGDILLSSGSKDGLIRLWRISCKPKLLESSSDLQVKIVEIKLARIERGPEGEHQFTTLYCSLESVLHGHEGLVSSLDWGRVEGQNQRLLSCSKTEDRSVVIWEPEFEDVTNSDSGIWVEKVRFGEVGGNREGFFNAKFGPDKDTIVAISYQGGFHCWEETANDTWIPKRVSSGHFSEVVDLDWDDEGKYLLTVSKDQTTRLHSKWTHNSDKLLWREIARPQVHGFDMACIACLNQFRFASAGEEKVVRAFTATKSFVRSLHSIDCTQEEIQIDSLNLPESATVPSLGLSNKGEGETDPSKKEHKNTANEISDGPPTEDELMLGTLWPEISKLYGHGNELLSLTSSRDGTLLASSCRATTELDAKIILWNTKEWKEDSSLVHHRLSVTQLEFSHCDQFLLSVSRDRSWTVFRRDSRNVFSLQFDSGLLSKKLQHARIIWSCAWVPKSLNFVTGSRDKTVVVWRPVLSGEGEVVSWERRMVIEAEDEVVAVAVEKVEHEGTQKWIIAIGCATGSLLIKIVDESKNEVLESSQIEICHRKSIRRLKFQPQSNSGGKDFTLASCGNDNCVCLHKITL